MGRTCTRIAVRLIQLPIHVYRYTLSSFFGHGCRYLPTCSAYALEALDIHGPVAGSRIAVRRLLRCNPWGGSGFDPVPSGRKHHREPNES